MKKRTDIMVTTDPSMAVSALRMLLIAVEDECRQLNDKSLLWIGSNGTTP